MERTVLQWQDGFESTSPELQEDVKELQRLLNSKGFPLEVDGLFGSKTREAVQNFQRQHGLDADGIVGPLTWGELLDLRPVLKLYDGFDFSSPDLHDDVLELQTRLKDKGLSLEVDGRFGPETERAVMAFQKQHGLEVDGIVGPRTWAALSGVLDKGAPGQRTPSAQTPPAVQDVKRPEKTAEVIKPKTTTPSRQRRGSIYYKDSEKLCLAFLPPPGAIVLDEIVSSSQRRLAQVYNRLGGLMTELGQETGIGLPAVLAVWQVESGGRAFIPQRAIIRFENHLLYRNWGKYNEKAYDQHFQHGGHAQVPGRPWENHRFRRNPAETFRPFHGNQTLEYEVLELAKELAGAEVAYRGISMGGPQILGENYRLLGYDSSIEMYEAFQADERAHVLGFFDFCRARKLINYLRHREWPSFTRGYNGSGQVGKYSSWIERAYDEAAEILAA